jgi:hypothetical protein
MSDKENKHAPWILWPFHAIWSLVTFILEITSRIICAILGLVLMATGVAIAITVVAAPIGIPITIFGLLLLVRALF